MNDEFNLHTKRVAQSLLDVTPQVMHVIRTKMRSHRGSDLSLSQFRTLTYLYHHPECALTHVAKHIGLTPPSASKMIDRLVRRGLVSRHEATADRRSIALLLTLEGKAALDKARQATIAELAEVLSQLDSVELFTLEKNLELLGNLFSVEELKLEQDSSSELPSQAIS